MTRRFTDISDDLAVLPGNIAAVKRLDDGSCAIFTTGQPATDGGFHVARPWEDVIEELNEELADEDDDGRDDDSDPDPDEEDD
jgi:hypothetical protein